MNLTFSVKFNDSTIIFFSLIHTCALHGFINLITIFEILYSFIMTIFYMYIMTVKWFCGDDNSGDDGWGRLQGAAVGGAL